MPDQTGRTLQNLELAGDYLQQVRSQLVRCDGLAGHTVPTLERVAALLQSARLQITTPEQAAAARQAISLLIARTTRAQMLLDAAANFLCGAALAGPATNETYAPDGTWETIYPNDQICLSA